MKFKTKEGKGITLIALVITIIVLLILAAVSIVTLTGENGILTKASEGKQQNEKAQAEEEVRLALENLVIEESQRNIPQEERMNIIEKELKQLYPKQQPESIVSIAGTGFLINHRGYEVVVDENYNISVKETKDEDEPFNAEEWDKTAVPDNCFIWESDIEGEEGYGIVIGYTANIENYTVLRFPSRCTAITFTNNDSILSQKEEIDVNTSRAFTNNIIKVEIPGTVSYIGDSAFGAPNFSSFNELKEVVIGYGVEKIGNAAFLNCTSLTSITIPNSITTIGGGAFNNCTSLTNIEIPNSVVSIGGSAFWNCKSLSSITIPNGVTSIEYATFEECRNLTSITISNTVTVISTRAFLNCTSLTSITIPNSVISIGKYAFQDCSSLTSINVDINNENYSSDDGMLFNKDKTQLIQCPAGKQASEYKIPDNVISIEEHAFFDCTGLTSVTIPNSVISIGDQAFSGWTSSQIINIQGYSSAPSGWSSYWNYVCSATINWGQ